MISKLFTRHPQYYEQRYQMFSRLPNNNNPSFGIGVRRRHTGDFIPRFDRGTRVLVTFYPRIDSISEENRKTITFVPNVRSTNNL
mmetsp:Transcript_6493/g.15427  ORF Transcript_6493/g.15427 Transcript_6493/m.15427 type:complete len:85 (+) Transcript_6493:915-1169(+)